MWLSTMINVGRSLVLWNVRKARASISRSLASPHTRYIPTVADESGGHIFRKSQSRIAFDGDVIVVVNPAEIGEAEVSGE